jgi:hypothetical protein
MIFIMRTGFIIAFEKRAAGTWTDLSWADATKKGI